MGAELRVRMLRGLAGWLGALVGFAVSVAGLWGYSALYGAVSGKPVRCPYNVVLVWMPCALACAIVAALKLRALVRPRSRSGAGL